MVKIVLGVVPENVEGLVKAARCCEEDGDVAHDGGERGLDLGRPSGGHAPPEGVVELSLSKVFSPRRVVAGLVPSRHVAQACSFVERQRSPPALVEARSPRPTALRGSAITVFHLSRRRSLAVEIDWPKRQLIEEPVPPERLESIELVSHGREAQGQGNEMWHEHSLELDV